MPLRDYASRAASSVFDGAVRLGQALGTRVFGTSPMTTDRAKKLDGYDRLYRGGQYEQQNLSAPWDKLPIGSRVPLRQQRPSVQYDLPRLIIDRPTAMLFGEGRFPELAFEPTTPETDVGAINAWLAAMADEADLQAEALVWARQGATVGSGVLVWCVVEGEICVRALKAQYCTPTFHARSWRKLVALELRYTFDRTEDVVLGGVLTRRTRAYWHRETWDETTHTVFDEVVVGDGREPSWTVSEGGRVEHGFGFVPGAWVKTLDDGEPASIDGISLLDGLADIVEDIDRTLTQKSRAVRYNQDPERVYKGLTAEEQRKLSVGGGASTSIPALADVKLLEMSGEGQTIAEAHVVAQRGRTLEVARVTVPDGDKVLAAARSGAAIKLLHQPTIELVGELRTAYGRALRTILEQIVRAIREGTLARLGRLLTPPPVIPAGKVKLHWPPYFSPTPEDIASVTAAASALRAGGVLDNESIVRWLAPYLGIRDVQATLARLEAQSASEGASMLTRPGKALPAEEPDGDEPPTEPEPTDDDT